MNSPRFSVMTRFNEPSIVNSSPPVNTLAVTPAPLDEITFPRLSEKKLYYRNNESGFTDTIEVAGAKALINPDNGNLYSVVSNVYQTIPYKTTLDMIEDAIQSTPEFGNFKRSVNFMNDGGRMIAKYRFTDHLIPVGSNADLVHPEVYVRRSYDTSWGFILLLGAFRLVCSNGLVVGEKILEYKHKHTTGLDQKILLESLKGSMDKFSRQTKIWESWLDRVTTPNEYERVMNKMEFGQRHTRDIEKEVEVSSNITLEDIKTKTLSYWMFFNIISQYITHKIKRNNTINLSRQEFYYDRMRAAFNR